MRQEDRVTVRPPAKKFLKRVDEAISALDSSASPDTVSRVVMACLLLGGTDDVRIGRMLGVPAEEVRTAVDRLGWAGGIEEPAPPWNFGA